MSLRSILESKVDDPDPVVRAHARNRLAAMGPEPEYPSLGRRALNLAGAVASHVASGLAVVDDGEKVRRIGICRSCPSYAAAEGRCLECGCYMEIKARWESGDCPSGRWTAGAATTSPS